MSRAVCSPEPTYSRSAQSILWGWTTSEVHQSEKTSLSQRGRRLSTQKDFSLSSQVLLEPMQPSYERIILIDDAETRMKIWKLFFGNRPLPTPEDHAVEKYYGVLDKFIVKKKVSRETIERIMEEL